MEAAKKHRCIFLAMSMTTSQQFLSQLISSRWTGLIFGTGDWYFYSGELAALLATSALAGRVKIVVPTGWNAEETPESRSFTRRFTKVLGHTPEPNSAYSYDAIRLALSYLCHGISPTEYDPRNVRRLKLLRRYSGLSSSGNYVSRVRLVTLDGTK